MAEEEKQPCGIDPETAGEPVFEETEIPSANCCEAEAPDQPEEADAVDASESGERDCCADPGHEETMQTLHELTRKVDTVAEAVDRNGKTVDCILSKVVSQQAPAYETKESAAEVSKALTGVSSKLDMISANTEKNAQVAAEIKAEALALHKLYQNDFAGRIRNMETELERYHKRDQGLAFDGIYKEIAQVYVDFEDLGDGVEDRKLKRNIRYLLEELEELLLSHGVERMTSEINEKRNLSFTQVVNRISTDDPALDGFVARSIASGFYIEKRCLIKEKVDVYRFEAATAKLVEETATDGHREEVVMEETIPEKQGSENE